MGDVASRESLSLKIYAETLASYERKNVFAELVTKKTITNGKSAQFIVNSRGEDAAVASLVAGTAGTVGANALNTGVVRTHGLGVDSRTLASDAIIGERTITVERPKIVRKNIDDFDSQIVAYNTRQIVTSQMGATMANYVDRRTIKELDKAMIATALLDANYGNIQVQDTASNVYTNTISGATTRETKGNYTVEGIFAMAAKLDDKDQMDQERYFVCSNETYYNILLSQKAVNGDWNAGDNGSIASGNVFEIGGVKILRSNNLVAGLLTSTLTMSGCGQTFVGFMFTNEVIGLLELYGLRTDQWDDKDYDQYVMKAALATGYGVLNPASLAALTTGTANV